MLRISAVLNRLVTSSVLVVFALLAQGSGASAAPAHAPGAWSVTVSGLNSPVCLGEPYLLTVTWEANHSSNDILAPLSGPRVINISAKNGSFDTETYRPGTPNGTTTFNYTAEKEGQEEILVNVFNSELDVDSSARTNFKIKKCKYLYELYSEANLEVRGRDVHVAAKYIIKSKGLLEAPDPSQPRKLEAWNKTVTMDTFVTDFTAPGCTVFTWQPGQGMGSVDAKADEAQNGMSIDLRIGPPQDFVWYYNFAATCDGEPLAVNFAFDLSSMKDPWAQHVFPFGEGEYPITLDPFEEGVRRANQVPENHASYTARLSLKKVEQ